MDYSHIMKELESASLFDLYRLNVALRNELENPSKINEIKKRLVVGQTITWFNNSSNKLHQAIIIKINRTRCTVENIEDNQLWDVQYTTINMDDVHTDINMNNKMGLKKSELRIGDIVSFMDNQNKIVYGTVLKLNPKTVGIEVKDQNWKVSYSLLSKANDIDVTIINEELSWKDTSIITLKESI